MMPFTGARLLSLHTDLSTLTAIRKLPAEAFLNTRSMAPPLCFGPRSPFWDFQAGIRTKFNLGSSLDGNTRTYAVIGLQGIAPVICSVGTPDDRVEETRHISVRMRSHFSG